MKMASDSCTVLYKKYLLANQKQPLVKDESKLQMYKDLQVLFNKVSSYKTAINVISYVLRFINNIRKKKKEEDLVLKPFVTTEEFTNAEQFCIHHVQEELASQSDFPTLAKNLDVFTDDDGILRCKGRLDNAPINYDTFLFFSQETIASQN